MNETEYVVTVQYKELGPKVYRWPALSGALRTVEIAASLGFPVEVHTEDREV